MKIVSEEMDSMKYYHFQAFSQLYIEKEKEKINPWAEHMAQCTQTGFVYTLFKMTVFIVSWTWLLITEGKLIDWKICKCAISGFIN